MKINSFWNEIYDSKIKNKKKFCEICFEENKNKNCLIIFVVNGITIVY